MNTYNNFALAKVNKMLIVSVRKLPHQQTKRIQETKTSLLYIVTF